jgi:hypothetical protein
MHTKIIKYCLNATAAALLVAEARATAAGFAGHVQIAGGPIAGSTVTLYAAGTGYGVAAPVKTPLIGTVRQP